MSEKNCNKTKKFAKFKSDPRCTPGEESLQKDKGQGQADDEVGEVEDEGTQLVHAGPVEVEGKVTGVGLHITSGRVLNLAVELRSWRLH